MSTMWSMCSMSTGHCSTQAPQVVHDHSTSGSITPSSSAVPTSGRVAWSGPEPMTRSNPDSGTCSWECSSDFFSPRSSSPRPPSGVFSSGDSLPSRKYGALANMWSRRFMITSLGDSGLPVFHAGHCDWQRPHSVQVVKSR